MSEQRYREAAEYFWNHILRRPTWDDEIWKSFKEAHEANGHSIAKTAWYIGEAVEQDGFTIEEILEKLREERYRLSPEDPFRDRPNSFFV